MPGSRRRTIPYSMFDHEQHGIEAKSARVLERIYHKGHAQAWDGREVLRSLIERHGPPSLPPDHKRALGRIFAVIMWGELAAWRISAELADEIEPLEAKMAATSQAFDEARHFYVMHDYLLALDALPDRLDRGAKALLDSVMNADCLAKKLLGMQLMVEPVALTLFHIVKRLQIEPVLTHLLPYYERDEARHVALGVQYLPALLSRMSVLENVSLWGYQLRLLTLELWSSFGVMKDMQLLGIDPRQMSELGKAKQYLALQMVLDELGIEATWGNKVLTRYADVITEAIIPGQPGGMRGRLRRMRHAATHGTDVPPTTIAPEVSDEQVPLIKDLAQV